MLNPKAAVVHLALIPQFVEPTQGRTVQQGFTLGLIQLTVSMVVNALIVLEAGSIARVIATRPTWAKWRRHVNGAMLGTVALLLAREVPQRARL
ncbi:threonine/homoserine/homoserine lactone efflux protein [Nakamurella sp. UYEF19]